jgi:hypothetical protein
MMKKFSLLLLAFLPFVCFSQVSFDFESGNLNGWTQVPDLRWSASNTSALGGVYSLKHSFNSSVNGTDILSTELPSWNLQCGSVTWQLKVRHGYDPSASNKWWVMLMSDQDANQMQLGGTCSGYAVGVNLLGSDDLLKLWRIDNGMPQVVIASALNWQTQIGKTNDGAIEIDRDAKGTFTLKVSETGSFLNLINYGSIEDKNHLSFNHFGVCYNYTSSADQLLWIDDISIKFNPQNTNDLTSEVLNPTTQITSGLILSTSTTPELAIDMMKFQIKDNSSFDTKPTAVKKITFKKANSENSANWVNSIGGVKLKHSSGEIPILNQTITSENISLEVDSLEMLVPSGSTDEYTLSLFLKPDSLVDGSTLKIMIDSVKHGFECGSSGSGFLDVFPKRVMSNDFKIAVEATNIKFKQIPHSITKNTPFTISVISVDNSGNLDRDFSNPISLMLSQGTGVFSAPSGLTKAPAEGITTWTDLNYNSRGNLRISASSAGFQQIVSNEISVLNDTTSIVSQPINQPIGTAISSLSCYPAKAIEILRFAIQDLGNTDGLPTIIEKIKISRVEMADAASLVKSVEGILVMIDGKFVNISQPEIKTNYLAFSFDNLFVPDGGSKSVAVYIYLKNQGLVDNQKIQLKVDTINHGFVANQQGSTFTSTFPQQIVSNVFWIDIDATQLKFSSTPQRVGVLQPFNISLTTTDCNGNIDKDFSGTSNLSLLTGNGQLSLPMGSTSQIISGNCIYNAITYSLPEKFSLSASSPPLKNCNSSLIICGDSDGEITPFENLQDSVLIKSDVANAENAVEVIGFNIIDGGATDGQPLIPSKISLHCFDPSSAEHLKMQIGGFVVRANGEMVDVESYTLNDDVFEIFLKPESVSIPNRDTVSLFISVFLAKGGVDDNFSFRFYIPATNHGCETIANGTAFANSFRSTIFGSSCKISVDATALKVVEAPFVVSLSQNFSLKVIATDGYGSVDNDYNEQLTLYLASGVGAFYCSNINHDLISGETEWSDVTLDKIGKYRFRVNSENLADAFSDEIYCGLDCNCLVNENFEGTLNQNWSGTNQWTLSSTNPLFDSKSLQHKESSSSGVSILSIPTNFSHLGEKFVEWNFTIRNGNWNPSFDNNFSFALMADSSNLVADSISGFFVGVNPSFGNNFLTLWRLDNGVKISLIKTSFNWGSEEEVTIRVGLTPKGEWSLWYKPKGTLSSICGGTCKSISRLAMKWSGLIFNYTSSRAGQLWLDNLSVCSYDYPPVILYAKALNLNTIDVHFSKKVNTLDALDNANYFICDESGIEMKIQYIKESMDKPEKVILKTDKLPFGKLKLRVDKIKGLNGTYMADSTYFGIGEQGTFGRLVINEIMANPIPSKGLPQFEYIEIYNPTNDTISLKGWKLCLNDYILNFPEDSIFPKQYAIICPTNAVASLSIYGKTIGLAGFPALLNSGMILKIVDYGGTLISFVTYNDSWYKDDQKSEGGWSLEKIDYLNLIEGRNNWIASNSPLGGTPCSANSVVSVNPDVTLPKLLFFEVISESKVLLQFSEPMDSLMLTYTSSYNIDGQIGEPSSISLIGDEYSKVILELQRPLNQNDLYNLCISEGLTDFSGNHILTDCIELALPQKPVSHDIVINEVLFNPIAGGTDFVELYNRSNKTFDLNKLSLSNRNSTSNELDQIYSVTDTSKLLFPNSYAVITTDPKGVKLFYYTENNNAFVTASKMASFNNDEGYVVLLNNEGTIIDELHYSENLHTKLLNDFKGVSLERINPELESSSSSTWHSAAQTVGFATPTYKNSQWTEPSKEDNEFILSPEIFSPDGDGRDDYLTISFRLPKAGSVTNIRIFDSNGIEVKRLASNLLIGTEGVITWDGLNNKNKRVPIGIYIAYIEYFNPDGTVKKYKKTFVVAEKL